VSLLSFTSKSYGSRAKFGTRHWIEVDDTTVLRMLGRVDDSVSPYALLLFLTGPANDYMTMQIVNRFAYQGDKASGHWPNLKMSTIRIRHALGYMDDDEINIRTQGLITHVLYDRASRMTATGAELSIPGSAGDFVTQQKLITAQRGRTHSWGIAPGAYTPPRPVLATHSNDLAALMGLLQTHIVRWVAGYAGMGGPI
jgi:hypothetical protein